MTPEDQELLTSIRDRLKQRLIRSQINYNRNPKPTQRPKNTPTCLEDLCMLNQLMSTLEQELSHVSKK